MSSVEGVGKPLPPITSNGTTGSVSTGPPYEEAEFMIKVSDNSPAPPLANSAKAGHRQLRPVIVIPRSRVVGYTKRLDHGTAAYYVCLHPWGTQCLEYFAQA